MKRYPYQRLQLAEELYSLKSVQNQALRSLGNLALSPEGTGTDVLGSCPGSRMRRSSSQLSRCVFVCPVSRFLVWETSSNSENHCLSVSENRLS